MTDGSPEQDGQPSGEALLVSEAFFERPGQAPTVIAAIGEPWCDLIIAATRASPAALEPTAVRSARFGILVGTVAHRAKPEVAGCAGQRAGAAAERVLIRAERLELASGSASSS
jgi:hypothetical protein